MYALTVRQPWAWAIIHGGKPIENRDWYTHHRGPLAIHAAQQVDKDAHNRALIERREQEGPDELLPRGVIIGVVDLWSISEGDHHSPWAMPTRYHWHLRRPRVLTDPIPWTGRLGLWHLPDNLVREAADADH